MLYKNIDYQKSNALHTIMKPYPNMVGLTSTNLQPKCNKKVYFMLKIGLRNVLYILITKNQRSWNVIQTYS